MKALLVGALLCLFFCPGMAQSFSKTFSIGGSTVFSVGFLKNKDDVIELKTALPASSKTVLLNNIDKQIFKIKVAEHIAALLPENGNRFSNDHKAEIDATLDKIFEEYLKQQEDAKKEKEENEIKFGKEEYYGLSESQQTLLIEKRAELRTKQVNKFEYERTGIKKKISKLTNKQNRTDAEEKTLAVLTDSKTTYDETCLALKKLERDINELKNYRKFQVSLIGNANVISSFKIAQQAQLNGGFGIIVSKPNSIEFLGAFTISQSNDTIASIGKPSEDFGMSVLVPGVRKFSLMTSYRQRQLWPNSFSNFWSKIGICFNANVTPYTWAIKKIIQQNDDSIYTKLIPVSMDLMVPFNWVNVYKDGQEINISTDIGFTGRYLMGNINAEQRKNFLGDERIFYGGLIAGICIRFNGLRFQFHAPLLFGSHVDGLTGGQVYASMSFVANIIGNKSIGSLFK
ncbi:MAG: hypothetical protein V4450_04420 [Bacteroidota bacterium]